MDRSGQTAKRYLLGIGTALVLSVSTCAPLGLVGLGGYTNDESFSLGIGVDLVLQDDSHTEWAVGVDHLNLGKD
jgi:hypothetical protein